MAANRLASLSSHLKVTSMDDKILPLFDELPSFHDFKGCAWEVWGSNDQLGTVNLLTEKVVAQAAKEEIKSGKTIALNWAIQLPQKPMFKRKCPHHTILASHGEELPLRDDELHINTQSGSQWDGLKHFGILKHKVYYNNVPAKSLPSGPIEIPQPLNIDPELIKLGIHNWAQHGICGRGVFLDLVKYYTASGKDLPYDPISTHGIPPAELEACAKSQGVEFRRADILLLRVGFIKKYNSMSLEAKEEIASNPETLAGLEQSEDMKRFLWNNHFAAVASDQPALESWPPANHGYLHQTILGLWGMPIGEMFDLEALSQSCAESGRYTFFFTSWPLNILGGVGSPANAAAYF